MNVRHEPSATSPPGAKLTILLMDANTERRALRKRIMALRGAEVTGASDLAEAASVWHRDRYDMVLIDIRQDHHRCIAWRNEIKKEAPQQFVAFLVGKPGYIALEPSPTSYVAEEKGAQWGDSLLRAIRQSCELLPQRNGFVEVGWRIAVARTVNGSHASSASSDETPDTLREFSSDQEQDRGALPVESPVSTFENIRLDNANSEGES
jgi:CheY-like chemotaxis protein